MLTYIKNWFKNFFEPKFKRTKAINKLFYLCFCSYDDIMGLEFNNYAFITDVKSRITSNNILELQVTCFRPGMLIGKAGSNIKKLEKEMQEATSYPTKILIVENLLWHFNSKNYGEF